MGPPRTDPPGREPLTAGRKTRVANCGTCRRTTYRPQDCHCRPACRWCRGFHAATTSPKLLNAWWGSGPGLRAGVSCGPARLVVLDIDAYRQKSTGPSGDAAVLVRASRGSPFRPPPTTRVRCQLRWKRRSRTGAKKPSRLVACVQKITASVQVRPLLSRP
ncbi:bifunctional DNA primase/polymerase [Streptomyces sp. NPDC005566]|uniref:bifunctional DNA primase/polymerase n=1 Tax=Streptomyces sp. NPDC005566 TaxID=3156886 RepID=UPI0033A1DAEB